MFTSHECRAFCLLCGYCIVSHMMLVLIFCFALYVLNYCHLYLILISKIFVLWFIMVFMYVYEKEKFSYTQWSMHTHCMYV